MKKDKLKNIIINKFDLPEKEAEAYILSGSVFVNDSVIDKTGTLVDADSDIRIKKRDKYVSRGAYKLLTAIDAFGLKINNKVCLDAGSSTGGFTQVLLEHGAKKVYAIDCGKNLIDFSLRKDDRVILHEGIKITDLQKSDLRENIDLGVMDISFSSSIYPIEHLYKRLDIKKITVLIKPQFEYERLSKKLALKSEFKGIVKSEEDRKLIINELRKEILNLGLQVKGITESKIKGTKGNVEYLFDIEGC